MTMQNYDVFYRDPTGFTIPNDGVTEVYDPRTSKEWDVLRFELESFVCSGEYAAGLERVLSTFLKGLHEAKQPAAWVSGFYGSGKSHFVRVLQYLWRDVRFPDGAQARSLVSLPPDISDLLRELATEGKRAGGLWSAAGTLGAGDDIRLAFLAVLFAGAGLPSDYAPARFIMWLRKRGIYDAVVADLEGRGERLADELAHMYVSPVLAASVLRACPELADTPKEVLAQLRNQFPDKEQITEAEMLEAMEEVLTLKSDGSGRWPLTLIVLDELQQSIGNDSDRTLQVQNLVQACSSRFGNHLLLVGTGQAALEASPELSKLQARFTVRVMLSDKDVQQVVREVVLRKSPGKVDALRQVLDRASGEIHRHLAGSKIGPRMADADALVPDYPVLPVRHRFWEHVLRSIDRPGTAAQLRTQLRMVHEAVRDVAHKPLGTVVRADTIYAQQEPSMLQSGVLLPEVATAIAQQNDGTPDGLLRSRLCAAAFLIAELPTEGVAAAGVRATADSLADLLVEDLTAGSDALRQRIPGLLQQLVDDGVLMDVDGEYRLQTRESAEWERERRTNYQKLHADPVFVASARATEFRQAVNAALKDVKLLQGKGNNVVRKYTLHFGQEQPPAAADAVPVWVRDEWNVSERTVQGDAQTAGTDSPVVFVHLPRQSSEDLHAALADYESARKTLGGHPEKQITPEGIDARKSMETRLETADVRLEGIVASILNGARVFQGGGNEIAEGSLKTSVEVALHAALVRLFPSFSVADDERWATVVRDAGRGAPDALSALGHAGNAAQHPVCKEILTYVGGAGKLGSETRKHFMGAGFGWSQDAVDGALLALLADGQVEALDKQRVARTAKEIPQSQIGVFTFRSASTVVTPGHRIGIRKLATDLGLTVKGGEEAQAIPQILQLLVDLADDLGGSPPLPLQPSMELIEQLRDKSGNEQFVAVHDVRDEIVTLYDTLRQAKSRMAERIPRWGVLQRLATHARDLSIAKVVQPQIDAIIAGRRLLDDVDPVKPLVLELSGALRTALQDTHERLVAAREAELQALQDTEEWNKLTDAQWRDILQAHALGPVEPLVMGTEDELLALLDAAPLRTWEDWIAAVPARIQAAREQAAKILAPSSVYLKVPSTTLRTVEEAQQYLDALRDTILDHIAAGRPVVL